MSVTAILLFEVVVLGMTPLTIAPGMRTSRIYTLLLLLLCPSTLRWSIAHAMGSLTLDAPAPESASACKPAP
jgi:hypothetical protein